VLRTALKRFFYSSVERNVLLLQLLYETIFCIWLLTFIKPAAEALCGKSLFCVNSHFLWRGARHRSCSRTIPHSLPNTISPFLRTCLGVLNPGQVVSSLNNFRPFTATTDSNPSLVSFTVAGLLPALIEIARNVGKEKVSSTLLQYSR
jgi:hypothetical protein